MHLCADELTAGLLVLGGLEAWLTCARFWTTSLLTTAFPSETGLVWYNGQLKEGRDGE